MSWEQIKKICFGALSIRPEDFYEYRISDLWLTMQGWSDREMFNLKVQRKVAIIISETVNRSMGGKGVADIIIRNFQLPDDKDTISGITPEIISARIRKYQEFVRNKRGLNPNNN